MIVIELYRARIGCFCGGKHTRTRHKLNASCFRPTVFKTDLSLYCVVQICIIFIYLITLKFNVNMSFLKLSMLMNHGDIESNPGPAFDNKKSVLGSFHQAHAKFGNSAGIQCSCNSLYAICFSIIKRVSLWKSLDIDYILENGDKIFKSIGIPRSLFMNELPRSIAIENTNIDVELLSNSFGFFCENNIFSNHSKTENGNGLIFTTSGYSFALIWNKTSVFLFDSHSRDKNGSFISDGTAVVLSFSSLQNVELYIRTEYSKQITNFNECQFELQYIKVGTSPENVASILDSLKKHRKSVKNKNYYQKQIGTARQDQFLSKLREQRAKSIGTPEHERMKKQKREKFTAFFGTCEHDKIKKRKCEKRAEIFGTPEHEKIKKRKCEKRAEIFGTPEHNAVKKQQRDNHAKIIGTPQNEIIKMKKRRLFHDKNYPKTSAERISVFLKTIHEGPYYICVVCNRCHYYRSVVFFKPEAYDIDSTNFYTNVRSFDDRYYICHTCHKKLKKQENPAQAVVNKLDVFDLPARLANMNRLEKAIISRRILFKKVTIMPKGQTPKLKGSICNVPVNTSDVVNSLPQGADSNGILMVRLKRKLMYRGHVYFEAVSPEIVQSALQYLKHNNALYYDIEINVGNIPENLLTLSEPIDIPIEIESDDLNEESDPLDHFRLGATETMLVNNVPPVEDIVIAPGEGMQPMSILMDEKCEELAHPYLFPTGKFGYKVQREIKLSPVKYFNQRLLNYTQKFASDSDYIFYALSVMQQLNLNSQINIAMKKVCTNQLTAGMLSNNFTDTVNSFIANDRGYGFMSPIKGTPAYWKKFLSDVLAMVKQLGLPTFFMTLSCADLRWNELVSIISKLKGENLTDEQIINMSYFERCSYLNQNPVLLARHFQYRVETFFKVIIINGPLGKVTYYAIRVEFQVRGSPHIHSFLWVLNAPVLDKNNVDSYVRFVDTIVKAYVPDINENAELHSLITTYQIHSHSKSCRKYKNQNCRYHFGRFFTDRTIISLPLSDELTKEEKVTRLEQREILLNKVTEYINENLDPKKRNILHPDKADFEHVLSISEILQKLDISEQHYYDALSISSDADFQIHLKRPPNSCFVNNYFDEGLRYRGSHLN